MKDVNVVEVKGCVIGIVESGIVEKIGEMDCGVFL